MNVTGGKILEVNAERKNDDAHQGLEFNINLMELKRTGSKLSIVYQYVVNYKPDVAVIKIKGELYFELKEDEAKKIEDEYKKNKIVPPQFAEEVLNVSNYTSATVGTLLAFAVNIPAPINLPRTKVEARAPVGKPSNAS